jgi:hypothetical protein
MEFPGLSGGLEQVPGLAGQDLRIRGPLDEEDGTGSYALNIARGIMPVKVIEKIGLEEELLGVVPSCDGVRAHLARMDRYGIESSF